MVLFGIIPTVLVDGHDTPVYNMLGVKSAQCQKYSNKIKINQIL